MKRQAANCVDMLILPPFDFKAAEQQTRTAVHHHVVIITTLWLHIKGKVKSRDAVT